MNIGETDSVGIKISKRNNLTSIVKLNTTNTRFYETL